MPRKTQRPAITAADCLKKISLALDDIAAANMKLAAQHQRLQALFAEMMRLAGPSAGAVAGKTRRRMTGSEQMIKLQLAMQRENTLFTSVSNVMKASHDTAKNAIGNVR